MKSVSSITQAMNLPFESRQAVAVCARHGEYVNTEIKTESGWQSSGCLQCLSEVNVRNHNAALNAERAQRNRARYLSSLPAQFHAAQWSECLRGSNEQQQARSLIVEWGKAHAAGHGSALILIGRPGTGKTTAAAALGLQFVERGADVRFVVQRELFSDIRRGFKQDRHESEITRPLIQSDLLILDEVGEGGSSDFRHETLNSIIRARLNQGHSLIITSNLSDKTSASDRDGLDSPLAKTIGARAFSAVRQGAFIVYFTWGDFRRPANIKE